MECWGEYLDLIRMKGQEAGEKCIMRNYIICTLDQKFLE
jgi:hypothetical protein